MANQSNEGRTFTEAELNERCGAGTRAWYAKASDDAIRLQMSNAWYINDARTYMVAKSYLALRVS